jgi:Concanavalin A-like lectin/glucanases superfamily
MSILRTTAIGALLAAIATAQADETGEPVYLSFIRQSRPVAHYRLNDSNPEAMRNLYASVNTDQPAATVVHGLEPVETTASISPHEFMGTNRINGLDFKNTGLQSVNSLSRTNSAVIIPGSTLPDFSEPHADELSLSVWVKASPQQIDRAGFISRKTGDKLDSYQFALSIWGGFYDIVMNDGDGSFRSFFTSSRPTGEWQHLVVVFDSKGWFEGTAGMLRLYINGEKVFTGKTGNHTRTQLAPSKQLDTAGFNNGFNGIIDELTLWDRALSDEEVLELFKSAIIGRRPMVIIIGSHNDAGNG